MCRGDFFHNDRLGPFLCLSFFGGGLASSSLRRISRLYIHFLVGAPPMLSSFIPTFFSTLSLPFAFFPRRSPVRKEWQQRSTFAGAVYPTPLSFYCPPPSVLLPPSTVFYPPASLCSFFSTVILFIFSFPTHADPHTSWAFDRPPWDLRGTRFPSTRPCDRSPFFWNFLESFINSLW